MTPEIAKIALQFMQRLQLTGQEVPAFNAVTEQLQELASPRVGGDAGAAPEADKAPANSERHSSDSN